MANFKKLEFDLPLPETLSELLGLALDDIARIEKSEKWSIDMDHWVDVGKCKVCLAGAVMLRHSNALNTMDTRIHEICPSHYSAVDSLKLRALNMLRCGFIESAVTIFGRPGAGEDRRWLSYLEVLNRLGKCPGRVPVIPYEVDRDRWFQDMREVLNLLVKHNL